MIVGVQLSEWRRTDRDCPEAAELKGNRDEENRQVERRAIGIQIYPLQSSVWLNNHFHCVGRFGR